MSKCLLAMRLQRMIDVAKQQRHPTLPLAALEELLPSEAAPPPTTPADGSSGNVATDAEEKSYSSARDLSLMERALEALASTLKAAVLINGGAAVALLAFVGNLAGSTRSPEMPISFDALRRALLFFVVGVAAAGFANVPQYAMVLLGRKDESAAAGAASLVVLALVLLSYAAFVGGGLLAFWAVG